MNDASAIPLKDKLEPTNLMLTERQVAAIDKLRGPKGRRRSRSDVVRTLLDMALSQMHEAA